MNSKVEQKKEAEAKRKEKQGTVKDSTTSNNFLLLLCFNLCSALLLLHNVQWGAGHQRPRRFSPREKGVIFPVMPSNSPSIRLMQFERAN